MFVYGKFNGSIKTLWRAGTGKKQLPPPIEIFS
jgi:hypothetical protein